MKNLLILVLVCMVMASCHKHLDFGVVWEEHAAKTQMTKDSLKIELEWYGDDAFMTATVKDKAGQTLAVISRQSEDDICTVIKYLRNDTGAVRGFLVYPGCYPVVERTGNAKIKENASNELEKYKEMLWDDFEDDVQAATAKRIHADYIITRNVKDFKKSEVISFNHAEFLARQ